MQFPIINQLLALTTAGCRGAVLPGPRWLALLLGSLVLPCTLQADHIPGLYNTGMKDDTSLNNGADPRSEYHYHFLSGVLGTRITGDSSSSFHGRHSYPVGADSGVPWVPAPGLYVYRTSFVMSGLNRNTARLRGLWKTYGPAQMSLNGVSVASYGTPSGYPLIPFDITTGFVDGTNFLDFTVAATNRLLLEVDAIQGTALPAGAGYRRIPDLLDTGALAGGDLVPARGNDYGYLLVSAPAGVPLGPARVKWEASCLAADGCSMPCGLYKNSPYAQWIGPNDDPCDFAPCGVFQYRQTFSLTGLDPASAKIDGWCTSDGSVQIQLNGVLATNIAYNSGAPIYDRRIYFTVTNGFMAGLNSLDFLVDNTWACAYGGYRPGALYVEGLQGSAKIDPNAPHLGIRVSQLELSWDSATNVTYQVQVLSSLSSGQWVNQGSPVAGIDRVVRIEVPVDGDHRFYRLTTVP